MMRKVVQIASGDGGVVALCNDGTVWRVVGAGEGRLIWVQAPDIPQPELQLTRRYEPRLMTKPGPNPWV
jgi:hypothetical protein